MLTTEHAETARKLLDEADRSFETGDIAGAYGKLWEASSHVVATELKRRDTEPDSLKSMMVGVERLADETSDPRLNDLFGVARACRHFAHAWFVTDYEFELDRPRVHRFVSRMLELSDQSAP